jgi:hypothetical protein
MSPYRFYAFQADLEGDGHQTETALGGSRVINTYGFQEIELEVV